MQAALADLKERIGEIQDLDRTSSLLAWDLYGDPARGEEIAERNRTGTAMLMPVAFEALGV